MAARNFRMALRVGWVVMVAGMMAAGTRTLKLHPERAQTEWKASDWRPGDIVPASISISSEKGYGTSYGIAIVEGKTILVVDLESRRVIETLE